VSLRARMGLIAGVAVALAVVAVAVSAYLGTRSAVYGQVDASLSGLAGQILHHGGPDGPRDVQNSGGSPIFGGAPGGFDHRFGGDCDHGLGINGPEAQPFGGARGAAQFVESSGAVCGARGQTARIPVGATARSIARSGHGRYLTSMTVRGEHIRVLVQGVAAPVGTGALMLALPLSGADGTLSNELLLMVAIAAAGIALAALLAVLVARAAVAPIARFTRQTERIAANPERVERERLEVTGDDELSRLARTFNATLDALAGSIAAQRNLVADASHELRTPIATIRANLQLLRDETLLSPRDREAIRVDLIEELDELTRLVSDVVELARGAKTARDAGDVRLDHVVQEAVERARRRGPELTFAAELEPTLVRGEPERIARAITNLLDNAIKWSPRAGTVEVALHGGVLSVRDHGPGFNADDLPFVFDRFHRARDARSKPGSGLGLAIVRQAAEAHDGFAEAANAPGGGALLRVCFGPPVELDQAPVPAPTLSSG
jgi:two-component system sensor histidine kinase MprB